MHYVLAVKQPIYGSQGAFLAYQFAQQLLKQGHNLQQIFFFQEGVTNGNNFTYPANDEFNLLEAWQQLQQQYNVPLNLCIAASQRRGIVNQESAKVEGQNNLAQGFTLAGLTEFSQAILTADRVITL